MLFFNPSYRETIVLGDGSRIALRLVRPDDKDLLCKGFERLSPESRYDRFLTTKSQLTDRELVYLTEVDGLDHFAMGAVAEGPDGREDGVAIARFVRSANDPRLAEPAIVVRDDWQRKGVGTLLLLRLVAAARERGIDRFAAPALAANAPLREVLAQLDHEVRIRTERGEIEIQVDLPDVAPDARPHLAEATASLRRMLPLAARLGGAAFRAVEKLVGPAAREAGPRDGGPGSSRSGTDP
jgi:GNAT superfamily N-acetyltransferase